MGRCHSRFPSRIDVHEHRAPTDDSVKLLKEMQKEALEDLVATVQLQDNIVNGVLHIFRTPFDLDLKAVAHFKLNGKEIQVSTTLPARSFLNLDTHEKQAEAARTLIQKISEEITIDLLKDSNVADFLWAK